MPTSQSTCHLRIVHVNDVYELTEFPSLATLISKTTEDGVTTISTLAGDFLAPSLLSSLDQGKGIVNILNETPIDFVCFGNHEADVPHKALLNRIQEYKGVWLNSNMPAFKSSPTLPDHHVLTVTSPDGSHQRNVALLGLLIPNEDGSTYRKGVFGGAIESATNVNASAQEWQRKLSGKVDCVIPLTHQDLEDDIALASTSLFPVVLGGHDHGEHYGLYGNKQSLLVKAGIDGHKACVIDLEWAADGPHSPTVTYTVHTTREFTPDPQVKQRCERHMTKVEALENMVLFKVPPEGPLCSQGVRVAQQSMGTFLTTLLRQRMEADLVLMDGGAIRGNSRYDRLFTFADLKKELFFETILDVICIPGQVVQEIVRYSRRLTPEENAGFLQVDDGVVVDDSGTVMSIGGSPINPEKEYEVGLLHVAVNGMNDNKPLLEWFAQNPGKKPKHDEFGVPAKPTIVEWASKNIWRNYLPDFGRLDQDGNGVLSAEEVKSAYKKLFTAQFDTDNDLSDAELLGIDKTVEKLVEAADKDHDGKVSKEEYETLFCVDDGTA